MTERSDYDPDHDRLSYLPLGIIHIILSSLPFEDAVRTSVLSRQWRYTWTSLHKLEFISHKPWNQDKKSTSKSEVMFKFISYALSVHKGSLHTFKLDAYLDNCCPNVDDWLIRLSTKDIKELILKTYPLFHSVHSSIYSCNKLTHLSLWCSNVGPPPSTFKGFSFLRSLDLHKVKISSTTFESLVPNSPLLERLELDQFMLDEAILPIHAPNLKYLSLIGWWVEMYIYAPLLAELRVGLFGNRQHGVPLRNYSNFLGGCTNLEKLTGFGMFTKVMGIDMESWNPNSLVFHRLKNIKLRHVEFRDVKQLRALARLLIVAPSLQILAISVSDI